MNSHFTQVKAYAPATVANLSVGFDVFGLALSEPGDVVTARFLDEGPSRIEAISGDGGKLPLDFDKNTAGVAASALLRSIGDQRPLGLTLEKGLPLNSGLGSSAASGAAAAVAVNALLGNPFQQEALLPFVMDGEEAACGTAHADNAAPCLLGGLVITSPDSGKMSKIVCPEHFRILVVHPNIALSTMEARAMLPETIELKAHSRQLARAVHTVLALEKGDAMTLRESMKDEIAEPIRKHHLPFFDAFQKVVHARNAIACGISGSGPSLFVLMESHQQSQQMDVFLKAWFLEKQGLKVLSFQASLNNGGARVIEVSP